MLSSRHFLAALFLSGGVAAPALPQASVPLVQAVYVDICVDEQRVEQVEQEIGTPLEKRLVKLPGVAKLDSIMSHGFVRIEVQFKGGAGEDDRATVEAALKTVELDPGITLQSVSVHLDALRADGMFPRRRGCPAPAN